MRLPLALASLALLLAGCDSQTTGDLDIGEFRGTFADVRASGAVSHDIRDARSASASTFSIQTSLHTEDGDGGYREVIMIVRLPLGDTIEATDADVSDGASAELVRYEGGVPVVVETASAGSVGLFRPEYQDREWFRIHGVVDVTFPSGTVAGEFRAVPSGQTPRSRCDSRGCVDY